MRLYVARWSHGHGENSGTVGVFTTRGRALQALQLLMPGATHHVFEVLLGEAREMWEVDD